MTRCGSWCGGPDRSGGAVAEDRGPGIASTRRRPAPTVRRWALDGYNERAAPFVWTKTAYQVLEKALKRQDTSDALYQLAATRAALSKGAVSRKYHSASSAAWQPEPAAVTAWR